MSTLLLLPWSFIRLSPANVGLLCSESVSQRGGWGRGLAFGCAVWSRRLSRRWRTMAAVSDFGAVGVFSFTAAAAAAIIGTSTDPGALALFSP